MVQRWMAGLVISGTLAISAVVVAEEFASTLDYIDSLPEPVLMEGVGNSHLEISTDNKKAQRYFDQGVSLLHDFWWFEAIRSFQQAARLDPETPMPYWGIYMAANSMANLSEEERDSQLQLAADKIAELHDNATARERYYLDAVMHLHEKEEDEGEAAYRAELEALLNEYPQEIEARLFLWLSLDGGFDTDGRPRDDQIYGQLLLESELEKHPDHQGLLHYWIHNQESGRHPETALGAAQRLARLAPNAGHIVHMPGHIHFRMGNYDAAHEQFEFADQADARYMRKYGVDPVFTWNYLHNISFLIANLAEAGRFDEAREYAHAFASTAEESDFKNYVGYSMVSGRASLEPFLLTLRSGDFVEAAAVLRASPEFRGENAEEFAVRRAAYQAYADGMAALQQDEIEPAQAMSDRLDALLWRADRDELRIGGLTVLKILSLELQAMVEHTRGNSDRAIELLERASEQEAELRYREPPPIVRPTAESLAAVYLANDEWEKARDAYRGMLEMRNKSGYGLFGIARSYELEGNAAEARTAYRQFLDAWASADEDRPRVRHARDWLSANAP